jgi:phosphate butyryltransferase
MSGGGGYATLSRRVRGTGRRFVVAVAKAEEAESFKALKEAYDLGICLPICTGNPEIIDREAEKAGIGEYEAIPAASDQEAAEAAVGAVISGRAQLLQKGLVSTATLLKAVLKEKELFLNGKILSHMAVLEKPDGSFLGITDGGMTLYPDLAQKIAILENGIAFFHKLGVPRPKVAVLSAVEQVNRDFPSTLDGAVLSKMAERGQFGVCVVEGPLSYDLSISSHAAEVKNLRGEIRGDADLLLVPDIVSGNAVGKALLYSAGYPSGGVILGAAAPILIMSRADSAREKLNSILLGAMLAGEGR